MFKLVVAARRRPGMTRRQFSHYAQCIHGTKVANAPADMLADHKSYVQNHVLDSAYGTEHAGWVERTDHDSVSELWFENMDAFKRSMQHPYYIETVQPDEPRFADHNSLVVMMTREEEEIIAGRRHGSIKLMHFLKTADGVEDENFFKAWRDASKAIVEDRQLSGKISRYVRTHALPLPKNAGGGFGGGMAVNVYSGVASVWLDREDDLTGFDVYFERLAQAFGNNIEMIDQKRSFALIVREVRILPLPDRVPA